MATVIQVSNKTFGLVYNNKLVLESQSLWFIFRMYQALGGNNAREKT